MLVSVCTCVCVHIYIYIHKQTHKQTNKQSLSLSLYIYIYIYIYNTIDTPWDPWKLLAAKFSARTPCTGIFSRADFLKAPCTFSAQTSCTGISQGLTSHSFPSN